MGEPTNGSKETILTFEEMRNLPIFVSLGIDKLVDRPVSPC